MAPDAESESNPYFWMNKWGKKLLRMYPVTVFIILCEISYIHWAGTSSQKFNIKICNYP